MQLWHVTFATNVNANGTLTIVENGVLALFIPTHGITGFNRNNNTGYGNLNDPQ
jgi:hypothetical protein